MKKKYILAIFLFLSFVICSYLVSSIDTTKEVREVFNKEDLKSNCEINTIKKEEKNYTISAFYPKTKYEILNNEIDKKINYYITYFTNEVDGLETPEVKYELKINFVQYEYEDYISYVFDIYEDYHGAHPSYSSFSVSYNIKENKLVDINYLKSKNKNILNVLSEYSYNELKNNERLSGNYAEEMLKSGTKPEDKNFSIFAFDKSGLKIIFPRYSVAPYSSGSFEVIVPYDKLGII